MHDRPKAPVVKLVPDLTKIVEAVLLILKTSEEHHKPVTQYDIVKTLFLADRRHLNEYGRPITFDNYVAMKHGPVPSKAYDLLKGSPAALSEIGGNAPWTKERAQGNAYRFYASAEVDEDQLAPSEIEILVESFITVKSLNFGQVRKLTHEDAAYIDAWEDDENGNGSYPMSLAMLFDVPNMDTASELEFLSAAGAI